MPQRKNPPFAFYFGLLSLAWTLLVGGLFLWDRTGNRDRTMELAKAEARAHFVKDWSFRRWATSHKLIYAPVSDRNPPDPYLAELPERDVVTSSGVILTVINPARIIRQMEEEYVPIGGVRNRITSLYPLRPGNAPDAWERDALTRLEQGASEVLDFTTYDGQPVLRLISAVPLEPGCLVCHSYPNIPMGGTIGGVGVVLPMSELLEREHALELRQRWNYGLIWLTGVAGILLAFHWFGRNYHARRAALTALEDSEARKGAILRSALDSIVSVDAEGRITEFNPAAERTFGRTREQVLGLDLAETIIPPSLRERHRTGLRLMHAGGDGPYLGRRIKTRGMRVDGAEFPLELTVTRAATADDTFFTAYLRDITEEQRLEAQLTYQATHDALTGLVNRCEFERRLNKSLTSIDDEVVHTLFYLDLDQFKVVNDTCGHVAGDEMLRRLVEILTRGIRATDTLARLGGDEFGILLEHCPVARALEIGHNLLTQVRGFRFVWEDKSFSVGVSIGVVPLNSRDVPTTEILADADTACYQAKEEGRNRMHLFSPDDAELARRRGDMHWVSRLNEALERRAFLLFRQRILPLCDSGSPEWVEILLRLQNDDGDCISAQACLGAAERFNLIGAIDRWVVDKTLDWLGRENNDQSLTVSINLSGHSVGDPDFHDFLLERISASGTAAERLCFEVTETAAVVNLGRAVGIIEKLRALGCRIALDDFGSGMSSFGYLQHLPVDIVKIDGQFVRDMADNPVNRAMVKSVNEIAHVMGKRTVAEFVENAQTLELLRALGVDYALGYHIERPAGLDT